MTEPVDPGLITDFSAGPRPRLPVRRDDDPFLAQRCHRSSHMPAQRASSVNTIMPCAGTLYVKPGLTPDTFDVTGATACAASIELVAFGSAASVTAVPVDASVRTPVMSSCTGASVSAAFTSLT